MRLGLRNIVLACCMVCAAFFASCHHALVRPNSTAIYYSDSKYINLLPTTSMDRSIDGIQHLDGTFSKNPTVQDAQEDSASNSFSGEVWVRANDSVLSITLMGSFGVTVAELTYANDSVSFASSAIDVEKMKPEYVLADFQACFYPYESLRENFEKSGFTFTESKSAGEQSSDFERILSDDGKVILRIIYKANEIDLINELRHYKYHITLGSDG